MPGTADVKPICHFLSDGVVEEDVGIRNRFYSEHSEGTKPTLPEEMRDEVITGEVTLHEVLNTENSPGHSPRPRKQA